MVDLHAELLVLIQAVRQEMPMLPIENFQARFEAELARRLAKGVEQLSSMVMRTLADREAGQEAFLAAARRNAP